MKIRNGFVSNSSTTSFVCDICGASEAGMDAFPEELGFVSCENGHIICEDEAIEGYATDEWTEEEAEYLDVHADYGSRSIKEKYCPVCQFEVSSKPDIEKYLLKKTGIPKEEVFTKIKEVNKRRKKMYHDEYCNYVYEKLNMNENSVLAELKEKYQGSYKAFLKELKGVLK